MSYSATSVVESTRLATRRLRRAPSFSLTVVISLAVGLGATGAIFALVLAILLKPLPYEQADRLVVVRHEASRSELPMNGISPGLASYYARRSNSLERVGVYNEELVTLTDRDSPERIRVASVTPDLLAILRPHAIEGRIPGSTDYEPGGESRVLLGHDLWVRRYGADPGIVGRTVEIDRNIYHVVGIAASNFHFPSADTEAWIAWGWPAQVAARASLHSLAFGNIARLKPGASIETASRELQGLVAEMPGLFPDVTSDQLERLGFRASVVSLKDTVVGNVRVALLLLQLSVGFLLLITWANASNIALVRAERLRRDVALARALGATDGVLIRRFLAEGVVLAIVGGLLGLGIAAFMIHVKFGFPAGGLPRLREVELDWPVIALVAVLAAVSGGLLGSIGFLAARRTGVMAALMGSNSRMSAGRPEQGVRRALVVSQVALALVLLISSGLMASSFLRLKHTKLGFTPEGLVTFRLPIPPGEYSNYHAASRIHDEVLRRLRAVPGVSAVDAADASTFPLTSVPNGYDFKLTTAENGVADLEAAPWGRLGFATPGYFRTMGIPLLEGRTFQWQDTGRDAYGVILSASLAKALFGTADPVGHHIRWAKTSSNPDYVVVGVVGDVVGGSIEEGVSRAFYFPNVFPPKADTITGVVHNYIPFDEVYVVKSALPLATLLPAIQSSVRDVDPKLGITRVATIPELVEQSLARTRLTLLLLLVGTGAAVLLGVIGIYGMLSYTVSLRRSEFGIRMALGASPGQIMLMVLREGALQIAAGITIGAVVMLVLSRYLRTLLFSVSATDPFAFAGMAILLLAVGLIASYVPARIAGRIEPNSALRDG